MKNCYEGTSYAKRNIKTEGSYEYVENLAQKFADLNQFNVIVYVQEISSHNKVYNFEPVSSGQEKFKTLIKFNRNIVSEEILPDIEKREEVIPIESEKKVDKRKKTKRDVAKD